MRFSPDSPLGTIHDWLANTPSLHSRPNGHTRYPTNISYNNELQMINMRKSRLKIPFMHFGECLHGVGSFKQSIFPQSIGMASSFDVDLVHRVGRAIGREARSIGIHACFSPVLDLGLDPRWGRLQGMAVHDEYREIV